MAAAIGALLSEAPGSHSALVAGIYGQLLSSGRLPGGAHSALARLHDLTLLEAHGVEIATELAGTVVSEAADWLGRIATPSLGQASLAPSN